MPEESGDALLATMRAILDGVSKRSNSEESTFIFYFSEAFGYVLSTRSVIHKWSLNKKCAYDIEEWISFCKAWNYSWWWHFVLLFKKLFGSSSASLIFGCLAVTFSHKKRDFVQKNVTLDVTVWNSMVQISKNWFGGRENDYPVPFPPKPHPVFYCPFSFFPPFSLSLSVGRYSSMYGTTVEREREMQ